MTACAFWLQGVAVWVGLPSTAFALWLLLGFGLFTRFSWSLLLLGICGLGLQPLAWACRGWAGQPTPLLWPPGLWAAAGGLSLLACAVLLWRLHRRCAA
jgi:hypothetical protein